MNNQQQRARRKVADAPNLTLSISVRQATLSAVHIVQYSACHTEYVTTGLIYPLFTPGPFTSYNTLPVTPSTLLQVLYILCLLQGRPHRTILCLSHRVRYYRSYISFVYSRAHRNTAHKYVTSLISFTRPSTSYNTACQEYVTVLISCYSRPSHRQYSACHTEYVTTGLIYPLFTPGPSTSYNTLPVTPSTLLQVLYILCLLQGRPHRTILCLSHRVRYYRSYISFVYSRAVHIVQYSACHTEYVTTGLIYPLFTPGPSTSYNTLPVTPSTLLQVLYILCLLQGRPHRTILCLSHRVRYYRSYISFVYSRAVHIVQYSACHTEYVTTGLINPLVLTYSV
ncbi:hypothetical protein J6590_087782 [Homalodisca vitripennis]|nr:hypothetical protein J6590_087782 [Homalodisca vitripennis]